MRKRRQIFIELTSLLDVILIMLFVILIQAKGQTANALAASEENHEQMVAMEQENMNLKQDKNALEHDLEIAREECESWKRQILTQNTVMDNSVLVTICVNADKTILFESEGEAAQQISYDVANENYARNTLIARMQEKLRTDAKVVFLVFQYDSHTIYQKEYEMLKKIVEDLQAKENLPLIFLERNTYTN
ncbi:MAG: hypothetical protein IJS08_02095 [Victivallales bacterium]|nr:hypothetical protein [Victivallales bacterium]